MRLATWAMLDDAFEVTFLIQTPGPGNPAPERLAVESYATSREAEKATGAWLKRRELPTKDARAQLARETAGGRATSATRPAAE